MPHVRLEYSDDLIPVPDFPAVFARVHAVLNTTADAATANAKSRAIAVAGYVGDGNVENAFVHLSIELMEGRSTDVKAAVSDQCLSIVEDAFSRAGQDRNLQITVAVSDLERATYRKIPKGTIPAGGTPDTA
ncbi:MAG: 5-carboxymethyl-2-hydroxymuconate Delta-isomerase [Acidimicrobiia bacterium]